MGTEENNRNALNQQLPQAGTANSDPDQTALVEGTDEKPDSRSAPVQAPLVSSRPAPEGQPIARPVWELQVCRIKDGKLIRGRSFVMDRTWYVIGRRFVLDKKLFDGERNVLNDAIRSVSRDNAYLIERDGKLYVQYYQEEGQAKALIRINEYKLQEGRSCALKNGDVIRLGNTLDGDRERCVEFTVVYKVPGPALAEPVNIS